MTSSANPSSNSMDTLTVTITNTRTIDGLIMAANSSKMTPEAYGEWLLTQDGKRYADANNNGVVTNSGFFPRFTPNEHAGLLAAATNTTDTP